MPEQTKGANHSITDQTQTYIDNESSIKIGLDLANKKIITQKGKFKSYTTQGVQQLIQFSGKGKKESKELRIRKVEKQLILTEKRNKILEESGNGKHMAQALDLFFAEKAIKNTSGKPVFFKKKNWNV